MRVVVATRSAHKLREIRTILRGVSGLELIDLDGAGLPHDPAEDEVEVFETFEGNALAKARHYAERLGLPVVSDDSGLEVDALGGAPGVHSKRYASVEEGVSGEERDRANNEFLLMQLGGLALAERTARYVCVAAFLSGQGADAAVVRGEVEGLMLGRPKGWAGFGYDPLFFHPPSGKTFAELSPREKNSLSHRGQAFRELVDRIQRQ